MACEIEFKDEFVQLNNRQFFQLIDFAIEIGEKLAADSDTRFVERMKKLNEEEFWPGRGIDIAEDFPDILEQKFWSITFFETARAIFLREVGVHDYVFWQSQRISQAYRTGRLFQEAVRSIEPRWTADTTDVREFDRVVNNIER